VGIGASHARPGDHVYAIIGCKNMMILRPAKSQLGLYQVVGNCCLHGRMDYNALLGSLPEDWRVENGYGGPKRHSLMWFVNSHTGEVTTRDPRLIGDPPGWIYEFDERGYYGNKWRKIGGKEDEYETEDPRLSDLDFLSSRGVDVKDIVLV